MACGAARLSFALPHGDTEGATNQTFRLIVKPDLWGKTIRLRLSNTFGSRPVTLGAVTVGLQSSGGNFLVVRNDWRPKGPAAIIRVMRKIFISHESVAKREAVKLKELLSQTALSHSQEAEFFLTSDWYSLESGAPWFSPLVEQLREADGIITIITRSEAFRNLWISFEIGVAYGSKKFPKIFVFGEVPWNDIPHPIGGLQLTDTGIRIAGLATFETCSRSKI